MVDLSVRGLRVANIKTNEVYTVYALVNCFDSENDFFIVYNDKLKENHEGFKYVNVSTCMPVEDKVGLME